MLNGEYSILIKIYYIFLQNHPIHYLTDSKYGMVNSATMNDNRDTQLIQIFINRESVNKIKEPLGLTPKRRVSTNLGQNI